MVARSSPPDTPARPCGACTAARSGPSRCWSWSWRAGERCRGVRGEPRAAPAAQRAPRRQRRRCPGSLWGGAGGWDLGVLLALGAPLCLCGLSRGSPLLSLGVVPGVTPAVPGMSPARGDRELVPRVPAREQGQAEALSALQEPRVKSSPGFNSGVPGGPAALCWLWVTGRAINRQLWQQAVS